MRPGPPPRSCSQYWPPSSPGADSSHSKDRSSRRSPPPSFSGSSPPRSPCSEATATLPRSPDNSSEAASRLSWDSLAAEAFGSRASHAAVVSATKDHCDGCWRLDSPPRSRRTSTIRTITRSPLRWPGPQWREDKSSRAEPRSHALASGRLRKPQLGPDARGMARAGLGAAGRRLPGLGRHTQAGAFSVDRCLIFHWRTVPG